MKTTKPLTELRDADITRVDAVKGGANGTRFLIAKAAAGEAGIVSAEGVRDLIAEPPASDTFIGPGGAVLKAESDPAELVKESTLDPTTEEAAPPMTVDEARAVLKQAKIARAIVAKADAEADPPADKKASDGDDADDGDDSSVEKTAEATPAAPVSLKKAKAMAKAAKLAKRAARDELAIAKARAVLAKIGRRNSAGDQAHVDAIDQHAAALGATAHLTPQPGDPGVSTPTLVTKASEEEVSSVVDVIMKAVGPLLEKDREEISAQLTEVSQQLAKVGRIALPGGPRVALDRDGSVIPVSDGEMGMTFEQAALAKIAHRYPLGSVEREAIEKAGATSAIKDLMIANANNR